MNMHVLYVHDCLQSQELYDILSALENLSHICKDHSTDGQGQKLRHNIGDCSLSPNYQIDATFAQIQVNATFILNLIIQTQEFVLYKTDILEHAQEALANEKINETASSVSMCTVSISTS